MVWLGIEVPKFGLEVFIPTERVSAHGKEKKKNEKGGKVKDMRFNEV